MPLKACDQKGHKTVSKSLNFADPSSQISLSRRLYLRFVREQSEAMISCFNHTDGKTGVFKNGLRSLSYKNVIFQTQR